MSIIELMVGIVVALLVGLAATSSATLFTAAQRQGIGAGGSVVSASTVLSSIKNDAATAGLGFFGESLYLCDRLNMSNGTATIDGATFTPVSITRTGAQDSVDLVYATRVEGGANVLTGSASTGTSVELLSFLPAAAGNAVLLAPPTGTAAPCVVRQVTTNTPSTDTTLQTLTFDAGSGSSFNQGTFATNPTYAEHSRVALLGNLRWHRYQRTGTNLELVRPFAGATTVIAANVMAFRAQYGISATGADTLAEFHDATDEPGKSFATLDATELPRVRALRVGIVTRSPQREKPPGGNVARCESTTTAPTLFGDEITFPTADTDWRCFRYRESVVVVPLRNLVYGIRS